MSKFGSMIGRVGRDKCTQLRGLLIIQTKKKESLEAAWVRDEAGITKYRQAIEATLEKLREQGC